MPNLNHAQHSQNESPWYKSVSWPGILALFAGVLLAIAIKMVAIPLVFYPLIAVSGLIGLGLFIYTIVKVAPIFWGNSPTSRQAPPRQPDNTPSAHLQSPVHNQSLFTHEGRRVSDAPRSSILDLSRRSH